MPYKDPEKRREAFKKYYEKNKKKVLEKNRKWAVDNPEKHAEIERKGYAKRTGGEFGVIEHDSLDEALNSLLAEPKPGADPVSAPRATISKDEMKQIVDSLKEIGS